MKCPECSAEIPEIARFCPECGRSLDRIKQDEIKVSGGTPKSIKWPIIIGVVILFIAVSVGGIYFSDILKKDKAKEEKIEITITQKTLPKANHFIDEGREKDIDRGAASKDHLSLGELERNLDPHRNTKVYIRDYWRKVRGEKVSWSGKVVDVKEGRGNRFRLHTVVGDRTPKRGYNAILIAEGQSWLKGLRRGEVINFTGVLRDTSSMRGFSVELTDVKVRKAS